MRQRRLQQAQNAERWRLVTNRATSAIAASALFQKRGAQSALCAVERKARSSCFLLLQ
jgi:hypothetical protein